MSSLFASLFLTFLLMGSVQSATASTMVVLPIRLDYPLIRAIFVQQAFTDPGEAAVIIDENDGCLFLKLQNPQIYAADGSLRLKAQVTLRTGLPVLETCTMPIELEGQVDVRLNVQLDMSAWTLHFQADELRFTTLDGKSSTLSAQVLDLVKEGLFGHLDQVTVNLSTSVQELRETLPLFFQTDTQAKISKWLQSIRPGKIEALPEFYRIELLMEIEAEQPGTASTPQEKPLSAEEMELFVGSWEVWDAFLIYQINRLALFDLDDQDRATILQTLLETRYQLVSVLASDKPDPGGDLVRVQFIAAWERFSPLFRKYLARDPSVAPLSFLVFLSAGDALATLDKLGPTLGLEISRDGLIRMARLLAEGRAAPANLDYSFAVDPALRKSLGFGPPLAVPNQIFPNDDVDIETLDGAGAAAGEPSAWIDFSPRLAFAAELPPADLQALKPWLVNSSNFDAYQQMVRPLFQEEAQNTVNSGKLAAEHRDLFETIMQATAWQESCFRQFTVKKGKLTYLRSWNNTSVGLMQINERVWRGLYRVEALRWSPRYNVQAGSEILQMYLSKYVFKKRDGNLSDEGSVARATYALYNSGPQNFKNFLARHAKQKYLKSDTLFWDKFVLTKAGEFDKLKSCLFDK